MNAGTQIVCLRHGESENVLSGASGAVPSAPLTALGRAQSAAAAAGRDLAGIRRVYASTALRARQTAEILAGAHGGAVVPVPDLVEIGIGDRDGAVDADLRRVTAEVLRAWVVSGDLDRRVANGESGHQVLLRTKSALAAIATANAGNKVALVGHVGSLTLGLSVLCGLGAAVWGAPLPPAVPFSVSWDGSAWHCPEWPDGGGTA